MNLNRTLLNLNRQSSSRFSQISEPNAKFDSQLDWPGFGSVRVRGSCARTWTCTLRFGSDSWWTWTQTKCSGSKCSVRVRTMFDVKKMPNLANFNTSPSPPPIFPPDEPFSSQPPHNTPTTLFIRFSTVFWRFFARFYVSQTYYTCNRQQRPFPLTPAHFRPHLHEKPHYWWFLAQRHVFSPCRTHFTAVSNCRHPLLTASNISSNFWALRHVNHSHLLILHHFPSFSSFSIPFHHL